MNWRKKEENIGHGIIKVQTNSFSEFMNYIEYVHKATGRNKQYVWRGQSCSEWKLYSSLDRKLITNKFYEGHVEKFSQDLKKRKNHLHDLLKYEYTNTLYGYNLTAYLEDFKLAVRGRRGANPPIMSTENDWWALGQHHGLSTPLLDWTGSPFVARFFSFENESNCKSGYRAIYGLWEGEINNINNEINSSFSKSRIKSLRSPIIEFIRPYTDENPRLVGQRGLFTRSPLGIDIEQWLKYSCEKDLNSDLLIKIIVPDKIRVDVLRALNRMNINHLSLFPDLIGASQFCNMILEDNGYKSG